MMFFYSNLVYCEFMAQVLNGSANSSEQLLKKPKSVSFVFLLPSLLESFDGFSLWLPSMFKKVQTSDFAKNTPVFAIACSL